MRIIRGKYGKRRFDVPRNITARPTTDFAKENIFNVIENFVEIKEKSVLDLFAGTGSIGFEFLSRGAEPVVEVENSPIQAKFITSVADKLADTSLELIKTDAFRFIETSKRQFDIIFADPPYTHPKFAEIPQLILDSGLVKSGSIVIIEHSKQYDFSTLSGFREQRVYGSVNFTIFEISSNKETE